MGSVRFCCRINSRSYVRFPSPVSAGRRWAGHRTHKPTSRGGWSCLTDADARDLVRRREISRLRISTGGGGRRRNKISEAM